MRVLDRLPTVLARDQAIDMLHRPRTIKRDHRRYIVDRSRLQILDVPRHPRTLKLERPERVAISHQFERRLIIERNLFLVIKVDHFATVFGDDLQTAIQHR